MLLTQAQQANHETIENALADLKKRVPDALFATFDGEHIRYFPDWASTASHLSESPDAIVHDLRSPSSHRAFTVRLMP